MDDFYAALELAEAVHDPDTQIKSGIDAAEQLAAVYLELHRLLLQGTNPFKENVSITGDDTTFVQKVAAALEHARAALKAAGRDATAPGQTPGREFALAVTALEDAQMRFTRGMAMVTGRFHPVDLEATV